MKLPNCQINTCMPFLFQMLIEQYILHSHIVACCYIAGCMHEVAIYDYNFLILLNTLQCLTMHGKVDIANYFKITMHVIRGNMGHPLLMIASFKIGFMILQTQIHA